MSELLTTKQLQELLKIDRVTVYRMLNDGRLKGVKIGNQWRFTQSEVDSLMGKESDEPEMEARKEDPISEFPSDCVRRVQEIFAGIIGIGAVTITLSGEAVTQPTFSNPFCKLMLSSPQGRLACQESWRKIALKTTGQPAFHICHAGLCYQRSSINYDGRSAAWFVAGQFYINPPDSELEEARLTRLSEKYNIPLNQLLEAVKKVPVLKKYQQDQVQEWTPKVADTVQAILYERADLMGRLQRIAALSSIGSAAKK